MHIEVAIYDVHNFTTNIWTEAVVIAMLVFLGRNVSTYSKIYSSLLVHTTAVYSLDLHSGSCNYMYIKIKQCIQILYCTADLSEKQLLLLFSTNNISILQTAASNGHLKFCLPEVKPLPLKAIYR